MIVPVYRKGKQRGTLSFLIDFRPSSSSSSPLQPAATTDASRSSGCCFCNGSSNDGSVQGGSRHSSICSSSRSSTCSCSSSRATDQHEHIIASTGQGPLLYAEAWTQENSSISNSRHCMHSDATEYQDQGYLSSWVDSHMNHSSSICSKTSTRPRLHADTAPSDQQDGVLQRCSEDDSGQIDSCRPYDVSNSIDSGAGAAGRYPTLGSGSSGPTSEVRNAKCLGEGGRVQGICD